MSPDIHRFRLFSIVKLSEMHAPKHLLIFGARNYLSGLEGGTGRALWRWAIYAITFRLSFWRDLAFMYVLTRVFRMDEEAAEDRVFGDGE